MRCSARKQLAGFCLQTAAAVAMAAAAMSAGAAGPCYDYCPPCYDGAGQSDTGMAPTPAVAPDGAAGLEATDPNSAQQPLAPSQDMNFAPQSDNFQAAASGEGSNVGHIGRADNFNRLNIFDSQSALPANRVWYGYQYVDDFHVFASGVPNVDETVHQALHRFGAEVKITCTSSVSFVTQYVDVTSGGTALGNVVDSWSNPQIVGKQVVYQDCDLTLSAVLGVIFPIGNVDPGELRESTTRLIPGLLWYYNTTDCIFNYGGFQYSAPLASGPNVDTFDWSFGTGYWLYRSCDCCGWVQNVSLQAEIFGKHVVGSNLQGYYPIGVAPGVLPEDRNVVDMTFGVSTSLCNGIRASLGYSLPVSSGFARKNELIATVGYYF